MLVVGPDFVPVLDAIADQLTTVTKIVVIGGHPTSTRTTTSGWAAVPGRSTPACQLGAGRRRVPALLVGHDRPAQGRDADATTTSSRSLPMAKDDVGVRAPTRVNLVAMPLFHIGGGGWAVAGMYEGATSVIVRDLDPAALIAHDRRRAHHARVPRARGAPVHADGARCRRRRLLEPARRSSTARRRSARRCSPKRSTRSQCKFWQAYGLTETTGAVVNLAPRGSRHRPGPNRHRLRSCGLPGPGVELRIVDDATASDVPSGEVGEIWIRSPQMMIGYWNLPEETAQGDHRGRLVQARATPATSTPTATSTSTTG